MSAIRFGNAVRASVQEVKDFEKRMMAIPFEHDLLNPYMGLILGHIDLESVKSEKKDDFIACEDYFAVPSAERRLECHIHFDSANRVKQKLPVDGQSLEIKGADILGPDKLKNIYIGDIDNDGDNDIAIKVKDGAIYVFHGIVTK